MAGPLSSSFDKLPWVGLNVYHASAKRGKAHVVRWSGLPGCFTVQARRREEPMDAVDVRVRVSETPRSGRYVLHGLGPAVEAFGAAKETEGDTVPDCAAIATTKTFESARVAAGFALRSLGFVDNEFEYDTG